jgi:hypothetical protein
MARPSGHRISAGAPQRHTEQPGRRMAQATRILTFPLIGLLSVRTFSR